MRMRLTPDASKMLICTTSGYLIIIHNLRLSTLSEDLQGFKVNETDAKTIDYISCFVYFLLNLVFLCYFFQPNMYRLMQLSQTTIPLVASHTKLFSHSRTHNRVEFVTDFPVNNDAEVISSLQVHPQGWCALSRNVSNGEKSEVSKPHSSNLKEQKQNMNSY